VERAAVVSARDLGTGNQCGDRRILRVHFFEQTRNPVVVAFIQRACRLFDRRRLGPARLCDRHRNDRKNGERGDDSQRLAHHLHII